MPKKLLESTTIGTKFLAYGFEAIARGAIEAGVRVVTGFPGNPNNRVIEAFEEIVDQENLYVERSAGEKVAFEVAWGASMAGQRALCSVNMLGTNCLIDALRHAMHHTSRGGLVLLSGDDVGGNTSALEVDTRAYAEAADMPILEPADCQEALLMSKFAFELSEKLSLPVMIRGVGKVMMSRSGIEIGPIDKAIRESTFHDPEEDLPHIAGENFQVTSHRLIHKRLKDSIGFVSARGFDKSLISDGAKTGIIAVGVAYHLAEELLNDLQLKDKISLLKIGAVNPLNTEKVNAFLYHLETVYCLEEGEPIVETKVRSLVGDNKLSVSVHGKSDDVFPAEGELFLDAIEIGIRKHNEFLLTKSNGDNFYNLPILPIEERPTSLCGGCPHLGVFYAMKEAVSHLDCKGYIGIGDVGCSFMGILPPYFKLHTAINMGGAISLASGVAATNPNQPVFAVVGDGGLLHSGISALINSVHNRSNIIVIVLDNQVLGNTGYQPTASSGYNAYGSNAPSTSLFELCKSSGAPYVVEINPLKLQETVDTIKYAIDNPKPAVIIAKEPCTLFRLKLQKQQGNQEIKARILEDICTACKKCMEVQCSAICWSTSLNSNGSVLPFIDQEVCNGCGMCSQLCPEEAIVQEVV